MKVKKVKVVALAIDEELITRVSEGDPYRIEMLTQVTKMATLTEVGSREHMEIRQMIVDNAKTLARIAVAVGAILSILTGVTVVV